MQKLAWMLFVFSPLVIVATPPLSVIAQEVDLSLFPPAVQDAAAGYSEARKRRLVANFGQVPATLRATLNLSQVLALSRVSTEGLNQILSSPNPAAALSQVAAADAAGSTQLVVGTATVTLANEPESGNDNPAPVPEPNGGAQSGGGSTGSQASNLPASGS